MIGAQGNVRPNPKEFREKIVRLARASGRRPRDIAEESGISVESVRRWMKQADPGAGRRMDGLSTTGRKEPAKLRRENRRLRTEREILARATAGLARETGLVPSGSPNL